MDLRAIRWEGMNCFTMTDNRNQCQSVANMVMDL